MLLYAGAEDDDFVQCLNRLEMERKKLRRMLVQLKEAKTDLTIHWKALWLERDAACKKKLLERMCEQLA